MLYTPEDASSSESETSDYKPFVTRISLENQIKSWLSTLQNHKFSCISEHSNSLTTAKNMEFKFRGLMAPVFTPFKDAPGFEVDLGVLPEYAHHLKQNNILGILVNGTSGEGVSMTVEERERVLEAWIKIAKPLGMIVMAQVGGAPLLSVQRMSKHAEALGADALLCLPDLFFKPKSEEELADYLADVGRAAPKTPLLYYHIPSFTLLNLDMGVLMDKFSNKMPTFAGIKFTHTDLEQGARCVHANNGVFRVFLGADQVTAGAWSLGFDSAISTTLNMYPYLSEGIVNCIDSGDKAKAMELQLQLNRNIQKITSLGSWVSSMKAAMESVTGLKMGPPRPPLKPVSPSSIKSLNLEN